MSIIDEKKILFLSFGDERYDGRLRELMHVANELGKVIYITGHSENIEENHYSLTESGIKGILKAYRLVKKIIKANKIDILFVDNRMACLIGLYVCRKIKEIFVVQDVRELYLIEELRSIKSKIGSKIEQSMFKYADIIICANEFRAEKMQKLFQLKEKPLVYENIRKLQFSESANMDIYKKKYITLFQKENMKIISTSGWEIHRTNDQFIKEMGLFEKDKEILIVGEGSKEDQITIQKIVKENNINNIHFIGKVGEDELKYLIQNSDIGVVNYGQYDTNNKYCASGKIFEFVFEGKPVVTTSNPPLKEFCEKHKVGIADISYVNAVDSVVENYDDFKRNVFNYIKDVHVEDNNKLLIENIRMKLEK